MEVLYTGIVSFFKKDITMTATTYLWMIPVYGYAVVMDAFAGSLYPIPFFFRGVIWLIIIWSVEFVSGALIKKAAGKCPWDYSESKYSFYGLIRWDYAFNWYAVGLFFDFVRPYVDKFIKIR